VRIIHLANHCEKGNGNVHVAVDLACIQAKSGHAVAYASKGGDYVPLLTDYGVRHASLDQNRKNPFAAVGALRGLLQLCSRFNPDILHAHMFPGAVLGCMASKIMRVPLVNTVHNSFDVAKSHAMRFGNCVVAVSSAEKELLLRRGFRSGRLTIVINGPNGSPREQAGGALPPIQIARPAVVTVCGLHKRKGVDILIRAFGEAAKGQPAWQLYIAGGGPDCHVLKALVEELGLCEKVHLLGYVDSPARLLSSCDIFALASLAEPGALVVSEARAAGCAIIGTAVGGIPEQLEYGRAGTLVEPGNVARLAAALQALMSNPERLAQAKASALANSEHFNIVRVSKDYEEVYKRTLSRYWSRAC
jgi:glycosyltransferase involved in cell wall biosynthesis